MKVKNLVKPNVHIHSTWQVTLNKGHCFLNKTYHHEKQRETKSEYEYLRGSSSLHSQQPEKTSAIVVQSTKGVQDLRATNLGERRWSHPNYLIIIGWRSYRNKFLSWNDCNSKRFEGRVSGLNGECDLQLTTKSFEENGFRLHITSRISVAKARRWTCLGKLPDLSTAVFTTNPNRVTFFPRQFQRRDGTEKRLVLLSRLSFPFSVFHFAGWSREKLHLATGRPNSISQIL